MRQSITVQHKEDASGNPAGGTTEGLGLVIEWQDGTSGRQGDGTRRPPNGAFVEGVIEAAIDWLEFYQRGESNCRENALAITHLQEAQHWLQHRTAAREAQHVEGTHSLHK